MRLRDEITTRTRPPRERVTVDPDFVADREQNDSQRRKRMDQAMRGKKITRPRLDR